MDRHRDVRRGSSSSSMAANNGLTRRRPRNANSLRDSPDEDGAMELQEPSRLRDRGGVSKKDRDRMSRNKRRRGDRLMHHHHHNNHNRGDGGGGEDESSDENNNNSLDDDDEDDDEEAGPGPVRMRPPTTTTTTNNTNTNTSTTNNPSSSSLSNHSNNHNQLHHRKSFPPAKVGRTTTPWKVSDEMGFSVPKKARSVSTKRSHECWIPGGGGSGELTHRQASTSPARPTSVAPPPASSSMAPASPSSSSASIRKKMKPTGQKHRPPKVSSNNNNNNNIGNNNNNNKPSSVQDDIEIEVAEVLYGLMRQSQCPTRQEAATTNSSQKLDSRDTNGSNNDAKSRVSSPVSASHSSKLPQNSSSSNTPMSAVAPKRKRPRPGRAEEENSNSAVFANKKIEIEQTTKADVSSAKLEKISGSAENFTGVGFDFGNSSQPEPVQPELVKPESSSNTMMMMDSKTLMTDESMDQTKKVVVTSPKKESSSCAKVEFDPENATATKATPTASVVESHREESFKFDLMAPPSKSSPERDSDMGFVSESKPVASDAEMKMESEVKGKDNVDIDCKKDTEETVLLEKKREAIVEESETRKSNAHVKHTMLDLQIDLEKHNKDGGPSIVRQQQQQVPQQHQSKNLRSEPKLEKAAQSTTNSLPLPMNLAGWPAGLPPVGNGMGQARPQAMTALEGNPASSSFVQPRPKKCATHYYVARNIYCHQQFTKMNPYWSAAAGPASLYGKQPYNLNVLPPTETAMIGNPLLGSFPGRNLNPMQEKSQADGAKDKSSVAANFMDSQPGKLVPKQLVLQQPPQQPALHGPAFIFPLNQQQAAVATTNKAGAPKSSNNVNATSSVAAQSAAAAPGNSSSTAAAAATTMSFNYPNMPGSEAQYVAILQNNGYPFPVPAHVGAQPTPFRGTPQAMPFFNGSFYSSQMMHTSQLQQQQQQQLQQQMQQAQSQQAPIQQGHQNTSTSSGSSSSQKHQQQHNQQQNHQQRLQSGGGNAASGNSTSFNASKNRTQKPQNQSFPGGPPVRQHEADIGVEDSPSTEDSRVSQVHKNVYNHNFAMPIHPKNFASMSSAALTGGGSGNHSERQQQQQQQQSIKGGPELISSQAFAMPFASFNGGAAVSGLDFSSMAQNHVIFQSIPEAARHGYHQQMAAAAAAAQAAQHKKSHQISEEGKAVSDSNNAEEERKAGTGKVPPNMGQAIVFSRPDYTDPSVSTILGNSVVESSARTLNLISSPGNGSRPSRSNTSATASVPSTSAAGNSSNSQQQQQQQQHMSQFMQLQKQQQMAVMQQQQQQMHQQQLAAAAAARAKPSTTNSSSVYTDRHSSSSMAGKFPNAHYFPELPVQGGSSSQSSQWKNTRTTASPVSSPSLASNTSSLKNLPQQQGRSQQGHTQISFGVNSKPGSAQHVQQMPTGNQSPSSPVVVGSPPTSVSKSAGGSPRASSTGSKVGTTSSLSSQQQAKNTSSGPSRKSSPVGGRNVPSNLGNSHANPAQCTTTKSQSHHHQSQQQHQQQQQQQQQQHQQQQQQQQHQQQKQALQQQAQLFFSNPYMQAHSPQSTSNNSNTSGTPNIGYFQQRRQPAEQQQQQQPGSSNTVSSGMLTLSPSLTLAGATTDPTKAVQVAAAAAAAAANMKGGLPPPGLLQAAQYATQAGGHQFMSTPFPYNYSVPPVQVKPSEQKQPAGNDNLRASWQPEKR